jgi:WD40 repeat protein
MRLFVLVTVLAAAVLVCEPSPAADKESPDVVLQGLSPRLATAGMPNAFTQDGKVVAVSLPGKRVIGVWQTATGERQYLLATQGVLDIRTGEPSPAQLAFSPDGRWLAATLGTLYHGHILVWDLQTGKAAWGKAEVAGVHSFPLTFTPDGKALVTAGRPNSREHRHADVTFWRTSDGRVLKTVTVGVPGALEVRALAFAADGKRWASVHLVEASAEQDRGWASRVSLWDGTDDKPLRTWSAAAGHVSALYFAADGNTLTGRCQYPEHIEVWDCGSGTTRQSLPLGKQDSPALSVAPDGKSITAAAEGGLRQWDLATGRPRARFREAPGQVQALSPDGRLVLGLTADKSVHIWQVTSLIKE